MTPDLRTALACIALVVPGLGCVSLPSSEATRSITLEQEWQLGRFLGAEIEQRLILHPNARAQFLLDRLARPLIAEGALNDRPWRVVLVLEPEPFTCHAPGGQIYVSTGLVETMETASQLVGLLAHELAHAQLRHSMLLLTQAHGPERVAALARGEQDAVRQDLAANWAASGSFTRSSQVSELAADRQARRLLEITGRDVLGLRDGVRRLKTAGDGPAAKTRYFLSHPLGPVRSEQLGTLATVTANVAPADRDQRAEDDRTFRRLQALLAD